ncbi:MAG: hypothetical protein AAF851_05775 [Myxococcota bacterium]
MNIAIESKVRAIDTGIDDHASVGTFSLSVWQKTYDGRTRWLVRSDMGRSLIGEFDTEPEAIAAVGRELKQIAERYEALADEQLTRSRVLREAAKRWEAES